MKTSTTFAPQRQHLGVAADRGERVSPSHQEASYHTPETQRLAQRQVVADRSPRVLAQEAMADRLAGRPLDRGGADAADVAQLQGDPPVQVDTMFGRVTSVNVPSSSSSRPEGTMGGREGSHTTAWSALYEGVRNVARGKSVIEAIAAVRRLLEDASTLPGTARWMSLSEDRQRAYLAAEEEADSAMVVAELAPTVDNLQRFISAYLAYRNLIPLSAVDTGGLAVSGGEPPQLAVLADYRERTPAELRTAILELLDRKAVAAYGQEPDFEEDQTVEWFEEEEGEEQEAEMLEAPAEVPEVAFDVPGAIPGEEAEVRVIAVINQHLRTMAAGFPEAFTKAALTAPVILDHFLGESGGGMMEELEEEGKEEVRVPGDRATIGAGLMIPAPGVVAGHPLALVRQANRPNAVQIELGLDGSVETLRIATGDRPRGLFGSEDMKHSTAWIAMAAGLQNRLEGQTLAQAAARLSGLLDAFERLPGMALTDNLSEIRQGELAAARFRASIAITAAVNQPTLVNVQIAVQNLLAFRNIIPLSAADVGGFGPGGKKESAQVAILANAETEPPANLRTAIWKLLDPAVVHGILSLVGGELSARVPGADPEAKPTARAGALIAQHLLTIQTLYPQAYEKARVETPESLETYLKSIGIVKAKAIQAIRRSVLG